MTGLLSEASRLINNLRRRTVIALLFAIAQMVCLLPIALLLRRVFNDDIPHDDQWGVLFAGLLMAGCYVANAVATVATRAYAARVTKEAVGEVREDLIRKVCGLPMSWHDRNAAGTVHAIVIQDCERVDRMVNALMSIALPGFLVGLGLAAVAAVLNPVLFLVLLVALPPILVATRQFRRAFQRHLDSWHDTARAFSTHAQLLLRGIATIRAAGAEKHEVERFTREIDGFVSAGCKSEVAGSRFVVVQGAVAAVAGVAVLIVGGILVARHGMRVGSLVAFYGVVALIMRQISLVLGAAPMIFEGAAAARRVKDLMSSDESHAYRGDRRIEFEGEIELSHVSFGYGERRALEHVSLVIRPGDQIAVVGSNGAGKTTLMAVILGLYRPSTGTVSADGVPLADLDLSALRRQIGVVLQDAALFPGTILDNITMGATDVGPEAVLEAAQIAEATEFIEALPEGFATRLTDGGVGLSGGQRQRIAIARALVGRPSLLLLDEPTANLSGELTARVMHNLQALPWQPAMMVITHDLAVAAQAQRVLRLDGGRLVADTLAERLRGRAWLMPVAASG